MKYSTKPVIQIRTGSDSDLPKVLPATKVFKAKKIPFETRILSAHRTPKQMFVESQKLLKRGVKICLAAAGGSAHLPGMTASDTIVPVVGIPITASVFAGLDSLLSIVQMPEGIPVGCVDIDDNQSAAEFCAWVAKDETKKVLSSFQIWFSHSKHKLYFKEALHLSAELGLQVAQGTYPQIEDLNIPLVVVCDLSKASEISKTLKFLKTSKRQAILSPILQTSNQRTGLQGLRALKQLLALRKIKGASYASVCTGISRPKNALLFAAQILGVRNKTIQSNLLNFRKSLAKSVQTKDKKISLV
jgi:5-(carboxyamino)imidazole ribonucleotide mutase